MRPTNAQIRPVANPLLTNMLIAYMNEDADFIARQAAPVVPVAEESGTYMTIEQKHWFADKLERRAYGDTYAQGGFTFGSDTYKTVQWGLEHVIPVEHERTSQVPMRLEQVGLEWLAHQSNLRKERAFAADFMTTGVWSTNPTPTDWDDSSGTPVTDIATYKRTVRQATGKSPNALFVGEIVYDALRVNAEVKALIQYTQTQTADTVRGLLAAVLDIDILGVSRAVYNSANTGQAASLAPIIDDDALLCIVAPGADMMSVSSLKTFTWDSGEGEINTYNDPKRRNSRVLQHTEQWDQKLVAANTGVFFADIV